jgi:DNA repair protein RecN (Recombination protein N)
MLIGLSIQNLVLIEHLTLPFEAGLSALTGETGAGKSILLDALGLALGMRGDAGLIRIGATQAIVAAEFAIPSSHPVQDLLGEQGFAKGETIVFRRIIAANGRSRAFVNDQLVSVGFLRQLGDLLLEIHGQFDRLLDTSSHRPLLDDFADAQDLAKSVYESYQKWKDAQTEWEEAHLRLETLKREESFLRFQLEELSKLNLRENEEDALLEQRHSLSHMSKLCDAVQTSWKNLGGTSILDALQGGLRALQRIQDVNDPKVEAATVSLKKALEEATEGVSLLEEVQQDLEDGPTRLQTIDDRLHSLRAAARKHAVTVADLPHFATRLKNDLNLLDHAEEATEILHQASIKQRQVYVQLATDLLHRRQER